MSRGDSQSAEFRVLLEALLEDRLSDAQQARLNELLTDDAETRRAYVQYMSTLAGLRRQLKGQPAFLDGVWVDGDGDDAIAPSGAPSPREATPAPNVAQAPIAPAAPSGIDVGNAGSPILQPPTTPQSPTTLGFVADCFRSAMGSLGRPIGMLLALVAVCAAAVAIVLAWPIGHGVHRDRPMASDPAAPLDKSTAGDRTHKGDEPPRPPQAVVARIVDQHHVQWSEGQTFRDRVALLRVGEHVQLNSGLVEIGYDNGARLLLEGPAELVLDSSAHVTLRFGQLAAQIPESAIGFTVQTPMVDVVDLGTEFGVRVSRKGMTDVAVFSGEVVATPRDGGTEPGQDVRLFADEVRRFWRGSAMDDEPLAAPDFTLAMPRQIPIRNPGFEAPRPDCWLQREIAGWTILSDPEWHGKPHGGVLLTDPARIQLPTTELGRQWGFIETRRPVDGGVFRTHIYQPVGKVEANTVYRLQLTVGYEGYTTHSIEPQYPFWWEGGDGFELGLWTGTDETSGPLEPLKVLRDPAPTLRPGATQPVSLVYRSPMTLGPDQQILYVRLSLAARDWCRVLFDNVKLEAAPIRNSAAYKGPG